METYNDWLAHHGIRGMKWDKRNGPPYPLSDAQRSSTENRLNPTSRSAKLLQLNRARGRKVEGTGSDVSKKGEGLGYKKPVGETNRPVESSNTTGRKRKVEGTGSDATKKGEGLGYRKPVGKTNGNRPVDEQNISAGKSNKSPYETNVTEDSLEGLTAGSIEISDKLFEDNPNFIYGNVTRLIDECGPYEDLKKDPANKKRALTILTGWKKKYGNKIANHLWIMYQTDEGEE